VIVITTVYELIKKQKNLTNLEYNKIYKILIKNNLFDIPFNIDFLDKKIVKLKYLNKSARGLFKLCQRKFDLQRVKGIRVETEKTFRNMFGGNLHTCFDKCWNRINYIRIIRTKSEYDLAKYIFRICSNLIPKIERGTKIESGYNKYIWKYAEYEAYRIYCIFDELGRVGVKSYIFPLYRELKIENYNINETGVIDVIHTLTDDTCAFGDYKTGNVKYYNDKWGRRSIEFELGSYYNLLLDMDNVYRVVKGKLVKMEYLRLKNGFVVYLNDWRRTFKYIELKTSMITELNKIKEELIEAVNTGKFEMRMDDFCFNFCEYLDICLKDIRFKNRYWRMDPEIKKRVDDIFLPIDDLD